jgi:multiple sugar transport system ATP-binding protein
MSSAPTNAGIRLEGVTKAYGNGPVVVDDIDLDIKEGEFMVLVGPSGCGKSTLLRMIAGLEDVTSGAILIDDEDVTHVHPRERDIAMVFQNYALYPHMNVQDNLGFGLKLRHIPRAAREKRVREVAETLGLTAFLKRKPRALSGGQRQRVAMGRAMVREPRAFLMDEPLSNLDAKLRVSMRAELARLHERLGRTTVFVTHDQIEAMTLGQRVAVLRDGVLQQCDTPQNLFHHPVNLFVAAFIGSPSMNLAAAKIRGDRLSFAEFELRLPPGSTLAGTNRDVVLGIRPTDFSDGSAAPAGLPRIRAKADVVEDLGAERYVIFPVSAPRLVTDATRAAADATSDEDGTLLADDDRALFCARLDGRNVVAPGETVELAIDHEHLHFFDPDSGLALGGRVPSQAAVA